MALEIGFQTIPASAMSSVKITRFHGTGLPNSSDEPKSTGFEKAPDNQQKNPETEATDLKDTVLQINEAIQAVRRELHFSVDEASGRVVVKVVNAENGETIRQIPSEELLELARHFKEGGTEGRLLKVIA
ncbi:MAG: flagellar protein FlaG [Methylococcaceae bacterium]|nr:flagellar protein FlaG [Methylococcaceae bacterium]